MDSVARPRRQRSWRGPPLTIKPRRSSSQPPMSSSSRAAGGGSQTLTIVYTIAGSDHYAVIPHPKSYEEALTAAVQRFSQSFRSATPARQVWFSKGIRTRRNRWIWTELDPDTFMEAIEHGTTEIRLCDSEQEALDSDDDDDDSSEYLSIILSEEDEVQSVHTNMTSLMLDSRSAKSESTISFAASASTGPASITQSLIDDAVHIYHTTTDYPSAIAKLEHAASVAPASHPDLKAQCYLHLGYLAHMTPVFPPSPCTSHYPTSPSLPRSPATPSFSNARSHFRLAHKLFVQSKNRDGQLRCKQATASVALDEHDWDSARSQILYVIEAGKREGIPVDEVWCWSALALVALKQGVADEADVWWAKAWAAGAT